MSQRQRRKKRKTPSPDNAREPVDAAYTSEDQETPAPVRRRWHPVFEWSFVILAMLIAWGISAWFRSDWCRANQDSDTFKWEGKLLPTTHDSYFFASAIKHGATNNLEHLRDHPTVYDYGALTILGERAASILGVEVADVVIYMPVLMGGLIAIPVVLIGRKYGSITWGFGAACLAGMGYSYYNRTVAGYFDTDMFSIALPALALYCLLSAHRDQSRIYLYFGALILFGFQFFYPSGASISIALGLSYMGFRAAWSARSWFGLKDNPQGPQWHFTSESAIIISVSLYCCNYSNPNLTAHNMIPAIASIFIMGNVFVFTTIFRGKIYQEKNRILQIGAPIVLIFLLLFGAPLQQIRSKTYQYLPNTSAAKENSGSSHPTPQYMNVIKTVVEAHSVPLFPKVKPPPPGGEKLPWTASIMGYQTGGTVAERVSGSSMAFVLALLGYILLVIIYPEFIIALPFIGIGFFALKGGHRFTIHMVPIAALSLMYLPLGVIELARRSYRSLNINTPESCAMTLDSLKKLVNREDKWLFAVLGARVASILMAAMFLIPNVNLAQARSKRLSTVLKPDEIKLIDEIRKSSKPGDYVHTWWDWGTAIWYHAQRNVLTHPGNQSSDTYICAKMLMTDSPRLSAHLGRTAVEYYHHATPGSPRLAVDYIFDFKKQTAEESLKELEEHLPVLPTRDVFMFLPYRLIGFYHVLHKFSERDLATGIVKDLPRFDRFNRWQLQTATLDDADGKPPSKVAVAINLGVGPNNRPIFSVDLKWLTLSELRRGMPGGQAMVIWDWCNKPYQKQRIITFHMKTNQWVHGKPLQLKDGVFDFQLLNGNKLPIPSKQIQMAYPSIPLKKVEVPGILAPLTAKGKRAERPGLHLICSQNPPMAMLVDESLYKSMLVQMLILGRADPEYFEKVAENGTGRVFKLKNPKQP